MDISATKNLLDFSGIANLTQTNPTFQPNQTPKADAAADIPPSTPATEDNSKEPLVDLQKLTPKIDALNKIFAFMDANIRFEIHEKTGQLMVQIYDQENDKVLKEFPPSEFLDTVASIRDYVGILLDKKI
ncbi:flagellar protein FlaG [Desulfosporosinus youngiae]|uniref:Flagellar protein FlaG n=1 Tax=Desulfosporosinus youngiae DSM 17734 TaxID=768710 RepID=H5XYS0_9FIRM|nr:flagellar protein FlaG [Desulfosporosinus youngiae]EHQ91626.1 flagellar protein FlaG [Desulfosporosinus youngiae DSM 17734]